MTHARTYADTMVTCLNMNNNLETNNLGTACFLLFEIYLGIDETHTHTYTCTQRQKPRVPQFPLRLSEILSKSRTCTVGFACTTGIKATMKKKSAFSRRSFASCFPPRMSPGWGESKCQIPAFPPRGNARLEWRRRVVSAVGNNQWAVYFRTILILHERCCRSSWLIKYASNLSYNVYHG